MCNVIRVRNLKLLALSVKSIAIIDPTLFYFTELESQIEQLRDIQRKYSNVLRLSRALTSHFYHVVQTQVGNNHNLLDCGYVVSSAYII